MFNRMRIVRIRFHTSRPPSSDPQGNGPTYADFPTFAVTRAGVTYHLQQLALLQWFTDEIPSSAYGGWYTFPIPGSLKVPAVYCP